MATKKRTDIQKENQELQKESKEASQKNLEVASFAEEVKRTLESLTGEATAETSQAMEQASQQLQENIDQSQSQTLAEAQKVDKAIDKQETAFEQSTLADQGDIKKLQTLTSEAKSAGVNSQNIDKATQAKTQEIEFLGKEGKLLENTQKDMTQKVNESKQRRQSARTTYQSKSTL